MRLIRIVLFYFDDDYDSKYGINNDSDDRDDAIKGVFIDKLVVSFVYKMIKLWAWAHEWEVPL